MSETFFLLEKMIVGDHITMREKLRGDKVIVEMPILIRLSSREVLLVDVWHEVMG